jgi:DNA-binding transcriptional ArsR family regulator
MKEGPDIVRIAALIGDPARANILTALMGGKALTVTELAQEAGVTLQTVSAHLTKLGEGGLVRARKQGRHKYFTLGGDAVAKLLETLMGLAASEGHLRTRTGPRDAAMRKARVCYNHLAGEAGVRMYDSLVSRGCITIGREGLALTDRGLAFVADFGVESAQLNSGRTPLCRECLDWSERRSHLAGRLGRALFEQLQKKGWAQRDPSSRIVRFSAAGEDAFRREFPIRADSPS